jgi:lipoprotein-releasing system permease protein
MFFPFFVSRKFTFSRKESKFISFISTISVAGIALGVATLIIALSILNGFEKTITSKIVDFDSHIKIVSYRSVLPDYKENLSLLEEITGDYLREISPYASKISIISSRKIKEGVNVKGILPEHGGSIRENITEGEFTLSTADNPTVVIGRKLANKLRAGVGDRLTLFSLKNDELPSPDNMPNIMRITVSGIFESGMAEYDDLNVYVHLSEAQKLFGIDDRITGYDITLNNTAKIDSLTEVLSETLRYPHSVRSIYQIHRNIFTWIELQKEPIPIVLALIIIVAVFNIIGTLLMVVLEKTNAIGVLKSIGATGGQVISIFLMQGVFLALIGIAAGNLLAFTLLEIQQTYQIITIPSSVYFMTSVPIEMTWQIFTLVSLVTLVLCILASTIPSYIASKISPVTSLRFG